MWFGLVRFYGISTIVGYSIPNPLLLEIYLIQLKIFMLIINQRNTYFFCVKFNEKSEHIAKSNLYCTYLNTYTHIYTQIKAQLNQYLALVLCLLFFQRIVVFEVSLLFWCVTLVIWSDVILCRKVFGDSDVICHTRLLNNVCLFIVIKLIFAQRQLFILNQ